MPEAGRDRAVTGPGAGPGVERRSQPGDSPWWQRAVLYQIYPRSFADSDADGNGDLRGVIAHLEHLAWLGVDGVWLSPVTVSPNADWGYDVADFTAIQPDLGTMADFDQLVTAAAALGIRVLLDLVPNHTSDRHPWFVESRSSRSARYRQWYVWADPGPQGPPNNWVSSFGGPAWTKDEATGQYYLHNHLAEQPDLNWWHEDVRQAFDEILTFWLDRGVAGFRIDVCNGIIKDAELRDNPPATEDDDFEAQLFGQRPVYNSNRPEVHEVLRRWRSLADRRAPGSVLIGETPVPLEALPPYYGQGDELHLAFNFPFITSAFEAPAMRQIVAQTEATLPAGAWPAWTGSNHDMSRLASRWCEGDGRRIRLALMMLLTLRGTPVLYQGDEIGLGDVEVPHEAMRDPLGVRYWPAYAGRDAMRTPMPWNPGPGGGFTAPGVTPWLPLGDNAACTVATQRDDPRSVLTLVRDLLAVRRRAPALQTGDYETISCPDGVWGWTRGGNHAVLLNFSEDPAGVALPGGARHWRALVTTDREGEDRPFDGKLPGLQGAVLSR